MFFFPYGNDHRISITSKKAIVMERQHHYKVRYAGKLIKVIPAHSKWEAVDRIYSQNIEQFPWIKREKLTAVKSR